MQKTINKVKQKKSTINYVKKTTEFKRKHISEEVNKNRVVIKGNGKLPGVSNFWSSEKTSSSSNKLPKKTTAKEEIKDSNKIQKKRLTATERYQRYIDEEERIKNVEDEISNENNDPHTPDEFERALLKDRNSSYMWIKYMAFHLETAEIEKARAVAKKAIASINFREVRELQNVWIALLNLEIRYGTDETYNEVLREATQRNDSFKIYAQTLAILLEMEKFDKGNKIIETLKKRFKSNPEMWLLVSESYIKMKNEKLAKEVLPKSLLSLKDKDHIDYMVKYALMMSRCEIHDFSQTIFEKILSNYNKNLSVWYTYIDMMVKNGQVDIARSLFERILVFKFPIKKLKSIFQKYIEFETKHGTNSNVSKIKKIAKKMLEKETGVEME